MSCEGCKYNTKSVDSFSNWCKHPAFSNGTIVGTEGECDQYKRMEIAINIEPTPSPKPSPPKSLHKKLPKLKYSLDELREIARKRQQTTSEKKSLEKEELSEYIEYKGKLVLKKMLDWFESEEKED